MATSNIIIEDVHAKLIFLNYMLLKDEDGHKHMQFINKKITDGKLKNNSNTYLKVGVVGDLKCSQYDKNDIEIQSITIKNPLSKIIEFVNDSLIFENKKIDLNHTNVSLRLQLNSNTKQITISEIIDTLQNSKPLITTKLD